MTKGSCELRVTSYELQAHRAETMGDSFEAQDKCRLSIDDCRMVLRMADFASQAEIIDVLIAPDGAVQSTNGNYTLDDESWAAIDKAFREHATMLPIDYEHQTLGGDYASPDGTSPAAGWVKALRYEKGKGLIASVAWTERARNMIRAGEYQYVSPVLVVRKADRKAIGLHSVGLTNKPAIVGMNLVAAKQILRCAQACPEPRRDDSEKLAAGQRTFGKDENMDELKLIGKGLGLAEADCTVENINSKIGELKKKAEATGATVNAACKALELKEDANADALVLSISTLKSAAAKGDGLVERLKKIEDDAAREKAQRKIDAYVAAHKLNPNDKPAYEAAVRLACSSPAELDALMANAKPFVEPGRTTPPDDGAAGGDKSRETIIANSAKKYRGDVSLHKLTTCKDFVSLALQDVGQARLSEEEGKKIAG